MVVLEQHIEIQQALQKLDSARFSNITSDEIDWWLNKAVERYVKDRVKPRPTGVGYDIIEKNSSDIHTILSSNVEPPTYVDIAKQESYIMLPPDYWFLINDRSYVKSDCNATQATIQATSSLIERTHRLKLQNSAGSYPYYTAYDVYSGAYLGFSLAKYYTGGYVQIVDRNLFLNTMMEDLNSTPRNYDTALSTGVTLKKYRYCYYERFRNLYYPDSLIFVEYPVSTGTITQTPAINSVADSISYTEPNSTRINTTYAQSSANITAIEIPNRLIRKEDAYELKRLPYYKSNPDSPISILSEQQLTVFFSESFIISQIAIDYIRKPQTISLTLNRSCDLPGHTHREICDLATEMIMLGIQHPSYQAMKQDNILET